MPIVTTVFERVLHFVLFAAAGIAFAVVALSLIERATGDRKQTIRTFWVVVSVGVFAAMFTAERIYHMVHRMPMGR